MRILKDTLCFTKFLSSRGTPDTLVDKLSLALDGDKENFSISPRLITWGKKREQNVSFMEQQAIKL